MAATSSNAQPCGPKPACGPQGDNTDDVGAAFLALLGIVGTVVGLIALAIKAEAMPVLPILGIAGPGIGAIGLGAVAGAGLIVATTFAFLYDRCLRDPDGREPSCSAGVINNIVPAFDSGMSYLFPFVAQHDMVGVVVKCVYWPLVQLQAANVVCSASQDQSPVIRSYYENKAVCAAAWGSAIGAVVGGIGGIVLGILAGAALGCAGTGPFYIFCLLIACLIAAIVAAACAIAGAFIGGNIAHAAAGDTSPSADGGNVLQDGDYVTTEGKTIINGGDDNARVYWFVNHTTLHGRSTIGSGPFRSHTDPDAHLTDDACPREPSGGPPNQPK